MKTTYVLESGTKVLGYFSTLKEAKEHCKIPGQTILCLKGQYFGEGFHKYRLLKTQKGFKKK